MLNPLWRGIIDLKLEVNLPYSKLSCYNLIISTVERKKTELINTISNTIDGINVVYKNKEEKNYVEEQNYKKHKLHKI